MKKSMIAVFAGLMSAAALADVTSDVTISFSTPGKDRYADNEVVCPGECYALVWTPKGSEFTGFNADGSVIPPSKMGVVGKFAEDGRCPDVSLQVDSAWVYEITKGTEGTWSVYLLDTRRYPTVKDADGNDIVDTSATPTVGDYTKVNGYGKVATLSGSDFTTGSAAGSVSVTTGSALPPNASDLKVTGIDVDGDNVFIRVTGSLSCLQYQLKSGTTPNDLAAPADGSTQYGADKGEMVIIRKKKSGAQFFQVNRK